MKKLTIKDIKQNTSNDFIKHYETFQRIIKIMLFYKQNNISIDFIKQIIEWKFSGRAFNGASKHKNKTINNTLPSHDDWSYVSKYSVELDMVEYFNNKHNYLCDLNSEHLNNFDVDDHLLKTLYSAKEIKDLKQIKHDK